mgnify:CR=1|jgi:hypothetical protein|tara:strand:+ start:104 stop:334 length:231 start_codon:yes stop_codon:yes gene_type:complete
MQRELYQKLSHNTACYRQQEEHLYRFKLYALYWCNLLHRRPFLVHNAMEKGLFFIEAGTNRAIMDALSPQMRPKAP